MDGDHRHQDGMITFLPARSLILYGDVYHFFSFLIFVQNQQIALFLEGTVNISVYSQILSSHFWRELHNFLST